MSEVSNLTAFPSEQTFPHARRQCNSLTAFLTALTTTSCMGHGPLHLG